MRTREHGFGLLVLAAVGCSEPKIGGPAGTGASTTMMVSSSMGGMVTLEGTTLEIPAGALPADTAITITSTTGSPPSTFKSWSSPVFDFQPDGLVFLAPVTVTLTFMDSPTNPTVYWSTASGGFENLGGVVAGSRITTSVTHFSQGFVAESQGQPADSGVVRLDSQVQDGPKPPNDSKPAPDSGTSPDAGAPLDGGGTCNHNGVCDADEDLACVDCGKGTADGGVPNHDGGSGTCNHNNVCDGGEDQTCADCHVAPFDGGVISPDGGGEACNKNGVCDQGEDPSCPDCASTCNHNGVCDGGEDPSCIDCNVAPSDGGLPNHDGGSGGGCIKNGVCDQGEDPSCPDCASTCNHNGVCDGGEDPWCIDCNVAPSDGGLPNHDGGTGGTCNMNGVCGPGEDFTCPDCSTSGDAGVPDGGAPLGAGFNLLAAHSSGSSEAVSSLDPTTGAATYRGSFSGLFGWSGQFRVAADNHHAYALGDDSSFNAQLWTLDLTTGGSTSVSVARNLFMGGVTDQGDIIVAAWVGMSEQVSRLDPKTGTTTAVGEFGGLWGWQGQMVLDRAAKKVYAIGQSCEMCSDTLYKLDLTTGVSSSVGVAQAYTLGGVRADGFLIASYWNGSSQRVVAINPATGSQTDLGSLGLATWYGSMTFDPDSNKAYAFGYPDSMSTSTQLYWVNVSSGIGGSVSVGKQYYAGRY